MGPNADKVVVIKVVRPSFANGVKTVEHWAQDHTEEEMVNITKKLQDLYDQKKLESTRGTEVDGGVEYPVIDVAAANEYLEFIGTFNPVSAHVV